jgi:hypothetical protein
MKFTPPNHPDFELVPRIVAQLNRVLTNINTQKRHSLNESKSRFLVQEVSGANLVCGEGSERLRRLRGERKILQDVRGKEIGERERGREGKKKL